MDKPELLSKFCRTCSEGLSELEDNASRISFVTSILEPLLAELDLFRYILENIVENREYPDIRHPTMFENEVIMHLDPAGHFSLRLFLWNSGEYDPIHDHNSWGVIGPVTGKLEVRTFSRLVEESASSAAALREIERRYVPAGKTYCVLPLDEGIHQTGNPGEKAIIQVSVYGRKQTDRSFVTIYDEISGTVSRLYGPAIRKRMLAEQALAQLK